MAIFSPRYQSAVRVKFTSNMESRSCVGRGGARSAHLSPLSRQLLAAGQPVLTLDCCWQLGWAGQPMSGARLRTQICDNSSSIHLKSKSRPDCLFIISLELRFSLQRSAFQRHHSTFLTTKMNGIRMFCSSTSFAPSRLIL